MSAIVALAASAIRIDIYLAPLAFTKPASDSPRPYTPLREKRSPQD
jgi:hypothetical protein